MKIALQLYTVRDSWKTPQELIETLKKVKELGYDGVEFAGFGGIEAEQLKLALDDIGLAALSSHESLQDLEQRPDELLDYAKRLGCPYIGCSYSTTATREEVERTKRVMRRFTAKAKEYGMQAFYHNHSHELLPIDGGRPLDEIKQCCLLELDTYWVFHAKLDPVAYMRENAAHIGLIHLKDGDLEGHPCALGEGKNDISSIVDAASQLGAQWLIVENDNPVPDGFSDAKRSLQYLKGLLRLAR